jgi:hypothetical protein
MRTAPRTPRPRPGHPPSVACLSAGATPKKIDGSDILAFIEAIAAPPTKPPLSPSAKVAKVRRRRAELRDMPESAVRVNHWLLPHGGPEERLLADERELRRGERYKATAYERAVASAQHAHAERAWDLGRGEGTGRREREKETERESPQARTRRRASGAPAA